MQSSVLIPGTCDKREELLIGDLIELSCGIEKEAIETGLSFTLVEIAPACRKSYLIRSDMSLIVNDINLKLTQSKFA